MHNHKKSFDNGSVLVCHTSVVDDLVYDLVLHWELVHKITKTLPGTPVNQLFKSKMGHVIF
jgi:hypothetical protein